MSGPQKASTAELEHWDFSHFLVQSMDCERREEAIEAAVQLAMERPKWRLSLQAHKVVGHPRSGGVVRRGLGWLGRIRRLRPGRDRPARAGWRVVRPTGDRSTPGSELVDALLPPRSLWLTSAAMLASSPVTASIADVVRSEGRRRQIFLDVRGVADLAAPVACGEAKSGHQKQNQDAH